MTMDWSSWRAGFRAAWEATGDGFNGESDEGVEWEASEGYRAMVTAEKRERVTVGNRSKRPRCGAPITTEALPHETCRQFVKNPGDRCYRHLGLRTVPA